MQDKEQLLPNALADTRSRAIDYSRQGIVITDPNQPDNPIVDVNPAFEVLTGYSRLEIVGRNCRFLQRSADDQSALGEIRRAIAERQHVRSNSRTFAKTEPCFGMSSRSLRSLMAGASS
jgi:PAS domain S-box-containing protein